MLGNPAAHLWEIKSMLTLKNGLFSLSLTVSLSFLSISTLVFFGNLNPLIDLDKISLASIDNFGKISNPSKCMDSALIHSNGRSVPSARVIIVSPIFSTFVVYVIQDSDAMKVPKERHKGKPQL